MTRLVYLSPVAWTSFAQRPQKFARWFHKKTGGDVLWVEPYPSRFPCLADFKKIGVNDKIDGEHSEPWLSVLKPRALPLEPLPASGLLNRTLYWSELIQEIKKFSNQQETLLVVGKPTVLALQILKELKNCKSVYDAMDDFPTFFKGLSRSAMARRELRIAKTADVVMASSTQLKTKWSKQHNNVKLVPNGLDSSLLPAKLSTMSTVSPKVFGYLGTIGAWFDWQWVIDLAESRPNDLVHVIGPVFNRSSIRLPENLKIFAPCSHQDALVRMLSFDIAIIPFLRNELTASVDPIKYYEYKALGLPIISTRFGEMNQHCSEKGVYLCDHRLEMNEAISSALNYTTTAAESEVFRVANDWDARFDAAKLFEMI